MANKMLIDASHPEETRVVVLRGNRVEDFDFESASKKPLRGNIYLAKVTRVEPSLQAAFIEYGGNRHGFLAFSEIHPDYYQIPVADRQALLEEEARAHREEDDDHRPSGGNSHGRRSRRHRGRDRQPSEKRADFGDESLSEVVESVEPHADGGEAEGLGESGEAQPFDVEVTAAGFVTAEVVNEPASDEQPSDPQPSVEDHEPPLPFEAETGSPASPVQDEPDEAPAAVVAEAESHGSDDAQAGTEDHAAVEVVEPVEHSEATATSPDAEDLVARSVEDDHGADEDDDTATGDENATAEDDESPVEQLGGDALEETSYRAPRLRRHYKIQEVIKRRQILLVQVVKEERGNKGAALTTYLSLAGRYSVLMPNTARGGGISRKITDPEDRKRLKSIAQELDVPEGMGIILRTAGAARGENEVKRDFEYLLRMWETVRETTLSSSAPKLVYEEGSLIKRSIRDLFSKEIDEICVSGEAAYREAKDYMRLLMPTHVKNVVSYKDAQPIFAKAGAEAQLDAMFSNHVTLKSGGYIVINQTEALVAIDVNSGRSTREHNIEDTALRTNLEAADEVARQLRLRDLAGLIVVDFIDMEEGRNNRAVERRIKDALKNDRARIQIGRISHFGLLEMSRQRIRTGVLEGSTVICPHCAGAGTVRSTSSIALHVLRVLEDTLIRSAAHNLIVRTRTEVALYILNQKRANLADLEHRFGVTIVVMADAALTGTVYHAIERGEPATPPPSFAHFTGAEEAEDIEDSEADADDQGDEDEDVDLDQPSASSDQSRRGAEGEEGEAGGGDRRRRKRRRRRGRDRDARPANFATDDQPSDHGFSEAEGTEGEGEEPLDDAGETDVPAVEEGAITETSEALVVAAVEGEGETERDEVQAESAEPRRRRRRRGSSRTDDDTAGSQDGPERAAADDAVPAPRRSRRARSRASEDEAPSLLGFETPSADRDIEADTAKSHPADAEPVASEADPTESVGLADLTLQPVEPAEPIRPVQAEPAQLPPEEPPTPAEPPRPKRSGWWQRAKATLTGE